MACDFLIKRILLVFLVRELDYASAFPRGKLIVYPESWQGATGNQQEGYGYGNRRPLQYIQSLRQINRKPNFNDQVQVRTLRKPQENSLMIRSLAQTPNIPNPSHQTQSLYHPWSEVDTKWIKEMSPSLSARQRNYPVPKPRSFEFNLKIPFAEFPGLLKGDTSTTKVSDLGSQVKGGASDYFQLHRPTSVQIQSSFNSPSALDGFSDKSPTKNQNKGTDTPEVVKPTFHLSLSVPIPPPTPSSAPSTSNVEFPGNLSIPAGNAFAHATTRKPANQQSNLNQGEPERVLLPSAGSVQQQTEHKPDELFHTKPDIKLITFPPGHASQDTSLSEPISQPALQPPLQSENVHYGYYSSQMRPVNDYFVNSDTRETLSPDTTNVPLSPLQYESVPSGHYNAGQIKLNGNNYGQLQTLQSVSPQLNFPPEQYDYGQFEQSINYGQNVETEPHLSPISPSSPTTDQSHFEIPSYGYYNQESATSDYYGRDNVEQRGQTAFSYQYSRDQSGQNVLPNYPTTSYPTSNFQSLSNNYQTQVEIPGQYDGTDQLNGKPKYTKLLIHMDDDTEQDDGQHHSFAAPTVNNYSPDGTPTSYMPFYSQTSGMDSGEGQYAYQLQEQMETEQIQTPEPFPEQANYAQNVGTNAGPVQTNFVHQQRSEPTFHTMQDVYYPNNGQYSIDQYQLHQASIPTEHREHISFY